MHIPVSWCQESTYQELQRLFLCVYGCALLNFHVLITPFFALIYKDPPQHRAWTSCSQHRLSLNGLGLKLFRYHRLSLRDAGFRLQTVNPPSITTRFATVSGLQSFRAPAVCPRFLFPKPSRAPAPKCRIRRVGARRPPSKCCFPGPSLPSLILASLCSRPSPGRFSSPYLVFLNLLFWGWRRVELFYSALFGPERPLEALLGQAERE